MTGLIAPTEKIVKAVNLAEGTATISEGTRLIKDLEGNEYGGSIHTERTVKACDLWTYKERKEYRDFMRLYKKGDYVTMLTRFGTTDPVTMQNRLSVEMQADPRLTVATRRGIINTTVEQQYQFGKRFAATESNLTKK